MKTRQGLTPFLLCLTVIAGAASSGRDAVASPISLDIDVNVFDDSLSPYGDWVDSERYGRAWVPRSVGYGWQPYRLGHWVYTDYGWTWVSDEEWGWATYHYGRWYFDRDYGWAWVPGRTWGPAWVAWRRGGGYIGWAALPPEAEDVSAYRYDGFVDPHSYSFVEERYLADPRSRSYLLPVARNATIVNIAINVTNYTVSHDRVFNRGVDVHEIERAYRRPVPRYRVRDVPSPREARVRGAEVTVYRAPAGPSSRAWRPEPRRDVRPDLPVDQRYAQEQQRLDRDERYERNRLRQIQDQEEKRQRAKQSADDLRRRREAELKTQAEREQRQRQVLEARYARERKAQPDQHRQQANPGKSDKGNQGQGQDKGNQGQDKDKDKGSNPGQDQDKGNKDKGKHGGGKDKDKGGKDKGH